MDVLQLKVARLRVEEIKGGHKEAKSRLVTIKIRPVSENRSGLQLFGRIGSSARGRVEDGACSPLLEGTDYHLYEAFLAPSTHHFFL
jgi:hypothetical protein